MLDLRHFTCNFSHRMAHVQCCISTAQACAKCGSRSWAPAFFLGILARNGFCEMSKCISIAQARAKYASSHEMAFVKHSSAFRLRGHAQSVVGGLGLRHFTCKFSHIVALLKCPRAFRPRGLAQSVGPGLGIGPPPQHHHS